MESMCMRSPCVMYDRLCNTCCIHVYGGVAQIMADMSSVCGELFFLLQYMFNTSKAGYFVYDTMAVLVSPGGGGDYSHCLISLSMSLELGIGPICSSESENN